MRSGEAATSADMPTQIGRYRVIEELGAGGMGVVYAADDPELARKVAIKLMYAEADVGRARRSQTMLMREAQALARLSHPNIVAIHDIGLYAGQVFVAMEFVAGRTVRRWLAEAPRSWQEIVEVFVQAGRGLMAAHAVGLVHRDVKPDNLLVGDDGRVRVADFGVARMGAPDEFGVVTESGHARPLATVAGRGTLVGTPPYMAPEQHENEGVGPHSDQFSFCVALYEALHGVRPFAGDSPPALAAAIKIGDLCRGSGPVQHPSWLEQAVVRGLAARPADRWPSLQALLDVLTLERGARRARWWRQVLLVAVVICAGVALVLGARTLQLHRARVQAERAAEARLRVVAGEIDRLLAAGRRGLAEETLQAFVGEPEHRSSRAAIDAWLLWADRMDARGEKGPALAAVVEAYTGMAADDPREPVIFLRIAELFRGRWEYDQLAALIRTAGERWPRELATARWSGLRADTAAARRDVAGLLAEVDGGLLGPSHADAAPVLRALGEARFTGQRATGALPVDIEGDGTLELALVSERPGGGPMRIHRMDAELSFIADLGTDHSVDGTVINRWPLTRRAGEPGYLIGHFNGDTTVYAITADGPRAVLTWTDDRPQAAAAADLDGDGVRELYVGTGSYTRKLYRLTVGADGVWQRQPAHPPTDAIGSDINMLAVGDYDGDGRDELAVACGPWRAYDVRILAGDGDGLKLAARRRIGHVRALASLRGVDGSTLLAITKDNAAASKLAFAPDQPHGEPPGLYVVRRVGAALETVYYAPLPAPAGIADAGHVRWLASGDLDGDGRDDLVARYEAPTPVHREFVTLLVWRQLADGSFAEGHLGHVIPHVVGNFDDDPAAELLVTTRRGVDDEPELALLGAGGAPLAAITAPEVAAVSAELADPVLARAWARAEDLAGFGLYAAAAEALARRVALAQTRADERAVQRRVAELYAAAGDHARAAAGHEELAQDGDVDAALAAVRGYEEALQLADALRMARGLAGRGDLTAEQRTEAEAATARLEEAVARRDALELRFDRSLAEAWRIVEPAALRMDRVRGTLAVDAFADAGDLMTLPLELTGGPLTVELELEVERAEWASQLGVVIRAEDRGEILNLGVAAGGGGGYLRRYSIFSSPDSHGRHDFGVWDSDTPRGHSRHVLTARLLPDQGKVDVVEAGDHPGRRTMPLEQQLRAGPVTLALRSVGLVAHGPQHMRAHVRRISLAGARLAPGTGGQDVVARALVTGAWHEAAAAAQDPFMRALAAIELGRIEPAIAALAAVDLADAATRRRVVQLQRSRPLVVLPLLRAAYGARYAGLLRDSLAASTRMHLDEDLQREWLAVGADLDELPATDADEAAIKSDLLAMRAAVWKAVGELERASRDLDAAIDLLAGTGPADRVADLEIVRAEVAAARGRVDEALAAATRALAGASSPGFTAERLRISAGLVGMQKDPRWQALLAAHAER